MLELSLSHFHNYKTEKKKKIYFILVLLRNKVSWQTKESECNHFHNYLFVKQSKVLIGNPYYYMLF